MITTKSERSSSSSRVAAWVSFLHLGQLPLPDESGRLLGEGDNDHDKVGALQQLVEGGGMGQFELGRWIMDVVLGGERPRALVVQDVHVEGGAPPRDLVSDSAEPDDADRLVVDLRAE